MSHEQKKRVYTVLLIEDDPMVQEVNRQFIERVEGFRVIGTAATGSEGLRLVRELEPDLIFLDIYMPSEDGTEALRKLRAEALPVDVIVVTAAKDAPTIRQMIRKGIRDYIIKPFKFERVRDALEQFRAHHTALMAEGTLSQVELDEILHRTGERSGEYSESGASLMMRQAFTLKGRISKKLPGGNLKISLQTAAEIKLRLWRESPVLKQPAFNQLLRRISL
ncbi:response regulator [Paenibacillus larvae]